MTKLSRRKISQYAAQRIASGHSTVATLNEVAAYLVDTKRVKEADLIARDIEEKLLAYGTAVVTAVSARPISAELTDMIEQYVKAHYNNVRTVYINKAIDTSLLAGVRIELPDKQLDLSVKAKLEKLTV